jgi:hypothetical protein
MGPKSYTTLGRRSNGAPVPRPAQCTAMRTLVASLLTAGLLAGCASSSGPNWTKPGASEQQIGRDTADCLAQAQIIRSGPQGPKTTIEQDRYRRCMTDRGYVAGTTQK